MKTAVSIPDPIFAEAERLVEHLNISRSTLYSRALQEFVARHSPNAITERVNRVVDEIGAEESAFHRSASRQAFDRVDW
jgi:metal-responsive CopG/Arc/MetJ family transcriptional regulator